LAARSASGPATAAWQPFAVAQANLIELLLAIGYDR
jgi:hypothetical protein